MRASHMTQMSTPVKLILVVGWLVAGSTAGAMTWYVATNGNDSADGTSWGTAKQTIQAAIDLTTAGDTVLVSNGIYAAGSRIVYGAMMNRVAITQAITVQSVNGPAVTMIKGAWNPLTTNGIAAMRCAYLGANSVLSGFTLTNGATRTAGDTSREESGGGVWCEPTAVVSDCVLSGNSAHQWGGGSIYGTLNNCVLTGNYAFNGGGSYASALNNCTLTGNFTGGNGGGSYEGTLNNCMLISNRTTGAGGGSIYGILDSCTLAGNSANNGGGSREDMLNNCVLTGNSAFSGGGSIYGILNNCVLTGNSAIGSLATGGGSLGGYLYNCIVYYNTASYSGPNSVGSALTFCCTTPNPYGTGNITNAPLFVASNDYRLAASSPCINAGNNSYVQGTSDLDGNPRIIGDTVDIGAYEFQTPASVISYAWLHQYSLPTDGSVDFADSDGDGMNNWQEWVAGTNPTNSTSVFRITSVVRTGSDIRVTWTTATGKTNALQRAGNVTGSFADVFTVANATGATTNYLDAGAATNTPPRFYRVRVVP